MRSFVTRFAITPRLGSFALLALIATVGLAPSAYAGCGCSKPPPAVAPVRPNVTYSGMPVNFFSPSFQVGQSYTVTFTAMTGATATASGVVVAKRDLADAVSKPQLRVTLPALPLGPAAITVKLAGTAVNTLTIADSSFTVAPPPLALPTVYGSWSYANQKAAVSRDGTVYFSLDLNGLQAPLVFEATMAGYALRFSEQDVVFKNSQGFLMQKLVAAAKNGVEPIPGMAVFPATAPTTTSDAIHYSRHEFSTYFLQHQERLPHSVDPTDPEWHLDGSRHIDHDHLIVAITGKRNDGTLPPAGATPAFTLNVKAFSLFYQGVVGVSSVSMDNTSGVSSYDPTNGATFSQGSVYTNGTLTMKASSKIQGDATAKSFSQASTSSITGTKTTNATPMTYMAVQVPAGIPSLGAIHLLTGNLVITGPGSFQVDSILLENDARLIINNLAGPVTLYVTGSVGIENLSRIDVVYPDPERFAIYVTGAGPVRMEDGGAFVGVVYAPNSPFSMIGTTHFAGAFLGKTMTMGSSAWVHYDQALRGK